MIHGRNAGGPPDSPPPYSPGDPRVREMREILAQVYFNQRAIVDLLGQASLSPGDYELEGRARLVWGDLLRNAYNRDELDRLLDVVESDPQAKRWSSRIHELRGPSPMVEAEGNEPLAPPGAGENELILGQRSTLLDVAFLAGGVERARSVVRLSVAWEREVAHGTAFLIDGNQFLTNHHVLFNERKEAARRVEAWFHHELDGAGVPLSVEAYRCDPDSIAGDSPHDWAVVTLAEPLRSPYRPLPLAMSVTPVAPGDRVYIIQHPLGGYKQIGLHHNVVTRVDDSHIQYMTDTDAGSSGSPVFNERWEIIALHHRYTKVDRTPEQDRFSLDDRGPRDGGREKVDYRNQGVRIERVIEGLKRHKAGT